MPLDQKLYRAFQVFIGSSLGDFFWYATLACAVWLGFSFVFYRFFQTRRISSRIPTGRQIGRELFHSIRSILIFGFVTALVVFAALSGWTLLYRRIEDYGWWWFYASIAIMILMHDCYFYWTHRLMHHRWFFRFVHQTHHLSTNPTPWAAYAFSPIEAVVQAGIGPLIVFLIPVHSLAFAIFMFWQISFNVLGHCGYEIFPSWFMKSRLGWFLNSITHHGQHHEKFRCNFGLYFNIWDRLMGTNHPEYELRFHLATSQEPLVTTEPVQKEPVSVS